MLREGRRNRRGNETMLSEGHLDAFRGCSYSPGRVDCPGSPDARTGSSYRLGQVLAQILLVVVVVVRSELRKHWTTCLRLTMRWPACDRRRVGRRCIDGLRERLRLAWSRRASRWTRCGSIASRGRGGRRLAEPHQSRLRGLASMPSTQRDDRRCRRTDAQGAAAPAAEGVATATFRPATDWRPCCASPRISRSGRRSRRGRVNRRRCGTRSRATRRSRRLRDPVLAQRRIPLGPDATFAR